MEEKYLYNAKRNTLHIKGYCCHTNGLYSDYMPFANENEALAYDGRAVSMCKICQKKRENIMKLKIEVKL